jgi:hypothetical protein
MSTFIPDKYYSILIRLFFSSIETDEPFDIPKVGCRTVSQVGLTYVFSRNRRGVSYILHLASGIKGV